MEIAIITLGLIGGIQLGMIFYLFTKFTQEKEKVRIADMSRDSDEYVRTVQRLEKEVKAPAIVTDEYKDIDTVDLEKLINAHDNI